MYHLIATINRPRFLLFDIVMEKHHYIKVFALLSCLLLLPLYSYAQEISRDQTLIIGRVSGNPVKHSKKLQPIVDYAVTKLANEGIKQGKVRFAKDNRQMISLIKRGEVDWITETPFSATLFMDKAKAEPFLLRWKKGVEKYATIFITKKDSPIKTLTDLKGKKVAFEDAGSTSGFFLPLGTILQHNLHTTELHSPRDQAPADMVGFIFSKNEINTSNWVAHGIVDAGVISNLDWKETDRVPEKIKEKLTIFHETMSVPRSIELISPHVKPEIKTALIKILTDAHNNPEAKDILKKYKSTKQFSPINQKMKESLHNVQKMRILIEQEY